MEQIHIFFTNGERDIDYCFSETFPDAIKFLNSIDSYTRSWVDSLIDFLDAMQTGTKSVLVLVGSLNRVLIPFNHNSNYKIKEVGTLFNLSPWRL